MELAREASLAGSGVLRLVQVARVAMVVTVARAGGVAGALEDTQLGLPTAARNR